jgi:hypothetical protein
MPSRLVQSTHIKRKLYAIKTVLKDGADNEGKTAIKFR